MFKLTQPMNRRQVLEELSTQKAAISRAFTMVKLLVLAVITVVLLVLVDTTSVALMMVVTMVVVLVLDVFFV